MTTPEGKQVISSGWSAAGITNALKNRETCLEPLDTFADIDPLVSEPSVEQDDVIYSKSMKVLLNDSCNSEWEFQDGDIFDVIVQEL